MYTYVERELGERSSPFYYKNLGVYELSSHCVLSLKIAQLILYFPHNMVIACLHTQAQAHTHSIIIQPGMLALKEHDSVTAIHKKR